MTLNTLTDAGIEGANDEGASGAVIDGRIYLFRIGLEGALSVA